MEEKKDEQIEPPRNPNMSKGKEVSIDVPSSILILTPITSLVEPPYEP